MNALFLKELAEKTHRGLRARVEAGKAGGGSVTAIGSSVNRLRIEHRTGLVAAEREIERIEARRKKLVESITEGVPASEAKDELNANAGEPLPTRNHRKLEDDPGS